MGLAIVERVVRDHGGTFELSNRGSRGSRAIIVLRQAIIEPD
jgi:nitrogen fixation/metabolism regulation signal transduction histidine kinase